MLLNINNSEKIQGNQSLFPVLGVLQLNERELICCDIFTPHESLKSLSLLENVSSSQCDMTCVSRKKTGGVSFGSVTPLT